MPEHLPEVQMKSKTIESLGGWGRYPTADVTAVRPEKARELGPVGEKTLARGLGRAYGDAALLSGGTLVLTERLNRILEFDKTTGIVRAEAGVSLRDLIDALVPQGWFVPVTPGTKFCTLGGCVAADVHGKNHHRDGTFSRHVRQLSMILASGETVVCSPDDGSGLFWATVGGMGLTGIMSEVTLQMTPVETAYMRVRHVRSKNLEHSVELLTDPAFDARYSVLWMDCLARGSSLGRGILMTGEHASKSDVSLRVADPSRPRPERTKPFPIDLPGFALNPFSIKLFNAWYNFVEGAKKEFVCDLNAYFYPLDRILSWNRMYGRRGFVQYQYVLPTDTSMAGTREILEKLSSARKASFLAVLKRFGPQGPGLLSFPTEGLTLALDIPMSEGLFEFLDQLDDIVVRYGGRIYLAKDSRMKPEVFRSGYPRADEFCAVKRAVDPDNRIQSDLSRRLGLCL